MKTYSSPLGNVIRQFILSFLVFMGLSVSMHAQATAQLEFERLTFINSNTSWQWEELDANGNVEPDETDQESITINGDIIDLGDATVKYLGTESVGVFNSSFNSSFVNATIYKLAFLRTQDEVEIWNRYSEQTELGDLVFGNISLPDGLEIKNYIETNPSEAPLEGNGELHQNNQLVGSVSVVPGPNGGPMLILSFNNDNSIWKKVFVQKTDGSTSENGIYEGEFAPANSGGIFYLFDDTGKNEFTSWFNSNKDSINDEISFYSAIDSSTFNSLSANSISEFINATPLYGLEVQMEDGQNNDTQSGNSNDEEDVQVSFSNGKVVNFVTPEGNTTNAQSIVVYLVDKNTRGPFSNSQEDLNAYVLPANSNSIDFDLAIAESLGDIDFMNAINSVNVSGSYGMYVMYYDLNVTSIKHELNVKANWENEGAPVPDHLVAGKGYNIGTMEGLEAGEDFEVNLYYEEGNVRAVLQFDNTTPSNVTSSLQVGSSNAISLSAGWENSVNLGSLSSFEGQNVTFSMTADGKNYGPYVSAPLPTNSEVMAKLVHKDDINTSIMPTLTINDDGTITIDFSSNVDSLDNIANPWLGFSFSNKSDKHEWVNGEDGDLNASARTLTIDAQEELNDLANDSNLTLDSMEFGYDFGPLEANIVIERDHSNGSSNNQNTEFTHDMISGKTLYEIYFDTNDDYGTNENKSIGEFNFNSNGNFSATGIYGEDKDSTFSGVWRIENGILYTTVNVVNGNSISAPEGNSTIEQIDEGIIRVSWTNGEDNDINYLTESLSTSHSFGYQTNTNDTSNPQEPNLIGYWNIYNGTNLDTYYGCAEIKSDGVENVVLANNTVVNNTWTQITNGIEIYNNGALLQTATFGSIENGGDTVNVTCTLSHGSSEARKLERVTSCPLPSGDTGSASESPSSLSIEKLDLNDTHWSIFEINENNGSIDHENSDEPVTYVKDSNVLTINGNFQMKYLGMVDDPYLENDKLSQVGFTGGSAIYKAAYIRNERQTDVWEKFSDSTELSDLVYGSSLPDGLSITNYVETDSNNDPLVGSGDLNKNGTKVGTASVIGTSEGPMLILNYDDEVDVWKDIFVQKGDGIYKGDSAAANSGGYIYFFGDTEMNMFKSWFESNKNTIDKELWFEEDKQDFRSEFDALSANNIDDFINATPLYMLGVDVDDHDEGDNNQNNQCGTNQYWDEASKMCKDNNDGSGDNTNQCGTNQYWDTASNSCKDNDNNNGNNNGDTSGGDADDSKKDIELEKMVFGDNNLTFFEYDFGSNSFGDQEVDQIVKGDDNIITLIPSDGEGNETIKYNGIVTKDGLTLHEFCINEGDKYFIGRLIDTNLSSLLDSLQTGDFKFDNLGEESDQAGFDACNANDIDTLTGKTLFMVSKRSYGDNSDYHMNYPYQVVGTVTLPELGDEVHNVGLSSQPLVGHHWNWSHIGKDAGDIAYVNGLESGKYVLRVEIHKDGGFEEYVYDANETNPQWLPRAELRDYPVLNGATANNYNWDRCNENNLLWYHPEGAQDGTCYDVSNYDVQWVPNVTPIDTADFNSSNQMKVDFNLSALYDDLYVITGNVIVSNDFVPAEYCTSQNGNTNDIQICEWNTNGVQGYNNWYGANRINISVADAGTNEHLGWYDIQGAGTDNGNGTTTYTLSVKSSVEGNYTIRVNKETFNFNDNTTHWESYYFNPETEKLVDEKTVFWNQSDETDAFGNHYWVPDTQVTGILEVKEVNGSKAISLGDINFAGFAATQIKLNGSVTFDDADYVQVELINVATGNWFGWTEVKNSGDDFNITLPAGAGEYIIKLAKVSDWNWENYYYNPETGKFVLDHNLEWVEVDSSKEYSNWIPDPQKTGKLVVSDTNDDGDVTQADLGAGLNINFASLDSQFYTLKGKVTVPSTFTPGEVCRDKSTNEIKNGQACEQLDWRNKEWLGWNNINFSVQDASNGDWLGWFEIDRDSAEVNGDTKTYEYKIKLEEAKDVVVRVNFEKYDDGVNEYEGYYINFQTNQLVSDRKIMHVPVLDNMTSNGKSNDECWQEGYFWYEEPKDASDTSTEPNGMCYDEHPYQWIPDVEQSGHLQFSESNKNVEKDINFVTLANNVYKLTGIITVPDGFIPSHDWQNRAMMRVEAINADTGEWIGDGHLSDNPVSGTTDQYKYSFKLQDVDSTTNIIVKLVKEEQKGDEWSWESYYINFGDDREVGGEGNNADRLVAEETVQWVESATKDDYGYNFWMPDVTQTGFLALSKQENRTIELNINYAEFVGEYENNKISLKGKVVLAESVTLGDAGYYWNNIRIELIDKKTGDWITSKDVEKDVKIGTEFEYEIDFPQAGDYIVKVILEIDGRWEDYYVNFGTDNYPGLDDKIVSGQKVNWTEAQESKHGYKNWMPDPEQTGFISLDSKVEDDYIIDFSAFENSLQKISGSVKVSSDFVVGEKFDANGNWNGRNAIRVEAINKKTGEWIASTEVSNEKDGNGNYPFVLKIGEADEFGTEFIIKVMREESSSYEWKSQEAYFNFGDDHAYGGDNDSLVSGKRVQWVEAEEYPTWTRNWKQWMPNPEQTGWIEFDGANPTDVLIDMENIGANDYKLSGTVTFKDDVNLSNEYYGARIAVIDASTGNWIADEPIENNGSYSVNIGEVAGDYILQINYWYNNYNNWSDSWWKDKYIDFGADNAQGGDTDSILNGHDVRWKAIDVPGQSWDMWIPDVNPLSVSGGNKNITGLDFDLSAVSGGTINGTITGIPAGAQYPFVMIINPNSYGNSWFELKENNGTYTFNAEELQVASYTVEFGYEKDGRYYHYFIKDNNEIISDGVQTVESQEVRWQENNGTWGPNPEDTTFVSVENGVTLDLNISLTEVQYNKAVVTLSGTEDDKYASADMNIPGKPFGRWEENTTVGTSVSFTFDDVKDGNGYILNFWYDNASYTCDGANCENLKKNAMWKAYDENDNQVCPKGGSDHDWDCDWDNSYNWTWKPDVTPLTLSAVDGIATVSATLPEEKVVSGSINLDSEYAGSKVYVNIFQHNGGDHNWADFTLDENGDVNNSMKVEGGDNYRIELWIDGLGGYVYTESGWINQNNSWEENNVTRVWEPKASTLISINENLNLGEVNIGGDYKKVTIVLENRDADEDVWVSLESNTHGYFGEGNANWDQYPVTYDDNITIKVPASDDYTLAVFPMNHNSGYASDGSGSTNSITAADTFNWNEKDTIDVTDHAVITLTFPSAANLGSMSGTVNCGSSDCSGWIEVYDNTNDFGKGTEVDSNGSYEIVGLNPGNFDVTFWSWSSNLILESDNSVAISGGSTTSFDLSKSAASIYSSITGDVTTDANNAKIALIKYDGSDWDVMKTTQISEGSFSFGETPKPKAGVDYYVAIIVESIDTTTGSSTTGFAGSTLVDTDDTTNDPDFGVAPSGSHTITGVTATDAL